MKELPLQKIYNLLEYNPETGDLVWKCNRGGKAKKGDIAGCLTKQGYRQIYIDNVPYYAHRIALALQLNRQVGEVDHRDGIRYNNKLENLREITRLGNSQNTKGKGTCLTKWGWSAGITVNYKKKHLGYFDTEEQAHAAYMSAKQKLHPTFDR